MTLQEQTQLSANGFQVVVSNIPDVKVIRTAYGEWNTVKELKAADNIRNFSTKTAIKGSELDGIVTLRYAMGEYTTANQIKNAKGSKALKAANIVDGNIIVELKKGTYAFCVQYDDESFNYYTITVE